MIEQKPFTPYKLDDERKDDKSITFTVRVNEDEARRIEWVMNFLQEEQRSKAFKQCFEIGYDVLQQSFMCRFRDSLFKNIINNKRKGISVVEGKIKRL